MVIHLAAGICVHGISYVLRVCGRGVAANTVRDEQCVQDPLSESGSDRPHRAQAQGIAGLGLGLRGESSHTRVVRRGNETW